MSTEAEDQVAVPGAPRPDAGPRRDAWAGERWWLPGTVVAVGAALVGWLVSEAWYSYERGGCGNPPGAKFACLTETVVGWAAAALLGPALLWWAYRRAGVRRPVPGVLVAAGTAFLLQALVLLVGDVGVLSGRELTGAPPPGVLVGAVLGLAVLGGGLAFGGPRRLLRAAGAVLAVGALFGAVVMLGGPVERAETRLELDRADVPVLVPPGWQVSGVFVTPGGDLLTYDVVPPGWQEAGHRGVSVDVHAPERYVDTYGDTCLGEACVTDGEVSLEVVEPGYPARATLVRDDAVLVLSAYDEDAPGVDLADLVRSMRVEPTDVVVERLYLR